MVREAENEAGLSFLQVRMQCEGLCMTPSATKTIAQADSNLEWIVASHGFRGLGHRMVSLTDYQGDVSSCLGQSFQKETLSNGTYWRDSVTCKHTNQTQVGDPEVDDFIFLSPSKGKINILEYLKCYKVTSLLRTQGKSDFPCFKETWRSDFPTFKRPSENEWDLSSGMSSSLNSANFTDIDGIYHFSARFLLW